MDKMTRARARTRLHGATLAWFLGLTACGTSGTTDAGVDASCTGPKPTCCASCLNDVLKPPVCTGGSWACPAGSVTEADCAGQCTTATFCTYLPGPECVSCADGTTSTRVCNEDAGRLECPAGTYEVNGGDAGVCAKDASTD